MRWDIVFFDRDETELFRGRFMDWGHFVREASRRLLPYADEVERQASFVEDENPDYAIALMNLAEGLREAAHANRLYHAEAWFN